MLTSMIQQFTDADDYAAAIRGTKAELTVTGRGKFAATLTRIDLHNLWMQGFSETLPRVLHSATGNERAGIVFRTSPGLSLRWNRMEMEPSSIIRFSDNHDDFQRSSGSASFGT